MTGVQTCALPILDILPDMPTEYQNDCEIFSDGVICVGVHMEIKEG